MSQDVKKSDYPYIVAWGRMMGSFNYYIEEQIEQARADGAPRKAIYQERSGKWITFDQVRNPSTREWIERWIEGMGVEA